MPKARFSVTYEIVTHESAEYGDAAERGYVCEDVTLRDALADFWPGYVEADSWPTARPRWLTATSEEDFRTGEQESRSFHIPPNVTASSARRVARLLGWKAAK